MINSQPPGILSSTVRSNLSTVILFCVSVPVLSEHITETLPRPSTACSFLYDGVFLWPSSASRTTARSSRSSSAPPESPLQPALPRTGTHLLSPAPLQHADTEQYPAEHEYQYRQLLPEVVEIRSAERVRFSSRTSSAAASRSFLPLFPCQSAVTRNSPRP